jgi:hypothetical protein
MKMMKAIFMAAYGVEGSTVIFPLTPLIERRRKLATIPLAPL